MHAAPYEVYEDVRVVSHVRIDPRAVSEQAAIRRYRIDSKPAHGVDDFIAQRHKACPAV